MNTVRDGSAAEAMELEEDLLEKMRGVIGRKKIHNYKIHITPGSSRGDNYLGVIAKVCVIGFNENGEKITLNWIAKIAPKGEALREMLNVNKLYEREVYVYEKLFPFFNKYQDEKAVTKSFDFHATLVLKHLEQYSFVMEDMKSIGYFMRDRKVPLDYNHVKVVLEAYGKLHAISFALRDQLPEILNEISKQTSEEVFEIDSGITAKQFESLHSKVIRSLDPIEDARALEKYKSYMKHDLEILKKVLGTVNEFCVIGHGDSWTNNMLFKYENKKHPDRPTRVCLLDWQLCRFGSPAFDLSYFIFTCTDKALRDKYYDTMIKFYYYSLCQHLADLGSDPEALFPFTALLAELKKGSIFGLQMSITVIHMMLSETDEIPDWQNTNDSKDLVLDYRSVNDDIYLERIRSVVLDFVKYGYLDFEDVKFE